MKIDTINLKTHNLGQLNTGHKILKMSHKLLALIVVAWMSNGIFTYAMPFVPNFIRYGIFALWLGLAIFNRKRFLDKLIIETYPLLFFLFYLSLISLFVSYPSISIYKSSILYLLMIYSIFLYYFEDKYATFQKVLTGFLFVEFIFIGINTYLKLKEDPMIARYLATGFESAAQLTTIDNLKGLGGYSYFYALVPIILLSVYLLLNYSRKKLVFFTLAILLTTLLIDASYTTAILFTFVFILILLLNRIIKNHRFIVFFIIAGVIFILTQGVLSPLLINLATMSWMPEVVSIRLFELNSLFLNDVSSQSDLHGRLTRYLSSLEAFRHNFLTGISVNPINTYKSGEHSAWLDTLAYFGLFAILMFCFFVKAYKYTKNRLPSKVRGFYNIYWLYFVCLGFVNTLFFANIFTIWLLFLPIVLVIFFKESSKAGAPR